MTSSALTLKTVAEYLARYIDVYRVVYGGLVKPFPEGAGLPPIEVSP